jgi:hypothetical protein
MAAVRGEIRSNASAPGAALTGCRVPQRPQKASRDLTWFPQLLQYGICH